MKRGKQDQLLLYKTRTNSKLNKLLYCNKLTRPLLRPQIKQRPLIIKQRGNKTFT